ncbi:hypothetical protein Pyn_21680 [Prunus yedoensis var. nudiflora]|uniref:Uncharacterized protein n=1 Tax=Prunus yedoensis var. nudiflora TaxID=2094558 RepID=A0A314Y2B0_PRUYE|nr:hypothetical protein Pyn_21680 [Prunus yedoensis var. nudiflora]
MEEPCTFIDPIDSKRTRYLTRGLRYLTIEEMVPDVMRPVAGRTGGRGPESWRPVGVTPPD